MEAIAKHPSHSIEFKRQIAQAASSPLDALTAALRRNRRSFDEIVAREQDRNVQHTTSDWHFTTKDDGISPNIYILQFD